jgi:hypothetical protein
MNAKDNFFSMGRFHLHDGKESVTALKVQCPNLFNIVRRNNETVVKVFSSRPLNVSFRRNLVAENLQAWQNLIMRLINIHLTDRPDVFR